MMNAAKCKISGSDYIGVFCTATDKRVFVTSSARTREKELLASTLKAQVVELDLCGSDLIGIFTKANSNGMVISELAYEHEIAAINAKKLDMNITVLKSHLNAVGCNILANDKIAIINDEYSSEDQKVIADALGVEVIKAAIGGFRTVGANSILTNTGLVLNNKGTEEERLHWEQVTGFKSIRTTANTGGLAIGLSVVANSSGIVAGEATTGYELARIMEALEA